jgi:TnpA family transposase
MDNRTYLGCEGFPEGLNASEIAHFFCLSEDELRAVRTHRRALNRLGVALQIGYLRLTGTALNSFDMIPQQVLVHLGSELGGEVPRLASIRALYRRRRTLFEHQAAARNVLGLRDLTLHGEWALGGFLRREVGVRLGRDELVSAARDWLAEHRYLQLPQRRLAGLAAAAKRRVEAELLALAVKKVGKARSEAWAERLLEVMPNGQTRMEWLRTGPSSRKPKGLANHIAKITFLKQLGADVLELGIPTLFLKSLARQMLYRKPATLRRMRSARKHLEIACFLRLQLLRLTDIGLGMIDYRIADLWRQARGRAEDALAEELRRHQSLVLHLLAVIEDPDTADSGIRAHFRSLLLPFLAEGSQGRTTKVGRVRYQLAIGSTGAADLLDAATAIGVDLAPAHPLAGAFGTLEEIRARGERHLPEGTDNPFGRTWALLLAQPDREAALGAYRAATLMLLKRSLRNGQASVAASLEHRAPEDRLIPQRQWAAERSRFVGHLAFSAKPGAVISWIKDELDTALAKLDTAVSEGHVRIDEGRLIIPRIKAVEEDAQRTAVRRALFAQVGKVQLPDLLVEIDAATHFSWILLGRTPRSEQELIYLYAALIALGSDLTAADMARMTLGITADGVGEMMKRVEAHDRLPQANRAVFDYFRTLAVSRIWGTGLHASADMMSLDATRHMWNARHDPRRRTPAIGTYTHVLDQWPILNNMPVILNRRQAGPAIEGALRHEQVELTRLAVDTHGHTHFAMALASLVGFDLCPRLAGLSTRKLLLPRGLYVPASLQSVVRETVSVRAIAKGWDPLLRIAASTKTGWCSATYILERFGSAARGDMAFQAGDAFGRLLLTRFLATYLGDPVYRTLNEALLAQGESTHSLQRAINPGTIGARHGRTLEQISAISGCLTLLANIIMTWNATRIGDICAAAPAAFPEQHIKHIAPNAHEHINTKGVLTIDPARHLDQLLGRITSPANLRQAR